MTKANKLITQSFLWGLLIGALIMLFLIGVVINPGDKIGKLGQFICDDSGMGKFQYYDERDEIVICEPIYEEEQFDGIRVRAVPRGDRG